MKIYFGLNCCVSEERGVTGQENKRLAKGELALQSGVCLFLGENRSAQEGVAMSVQRKDM